MSEPLRLPPQATFEGITGPTSGQPPLSGAFTGEIPSSDPKTVKAVQNWLELSTKKRKESLLEPPISPSISLLPGSSKPSKVFRLSLPQTPEKSTVFFPPPLPACFTGVIPPCPTPPKTTEIVQHTVPTTAQLKRQNFECWVNGLEINKNNLFITEKQLIKAKNLIAIRSSLEEEVRHEKGLSITKHQSAKKDLIKIRSSLDRVWREMSGARPFTLFDYLIQAQITEFEKNIEKTFPLEMVEEEIDDLMEEEESISSNMEDEGEPISPMDCNTLDMDSSCSEEVDKEGENAKMIEGFFVEEHEKFINGLKADKIAFSEIFANLKTNYKLTILMGKICKKTWNKNDLLALRKSLILSIKLVEVLRKSVKKIFKSHQRFTEYVGHLHKKIKEVKTSLQTQSPTDTIRFISLFTSEEFSMTAEGVDLNEVADLWAHYSNLFWDCLDYRKIFLSKLCSTLSQIDTFYKLGLLTMGELQTDDTNNNQKDRDQTDNMVRIPKENNSA